MMQAGSQVSLEYDINLSLTQIPENLIFYSDSARTNAIYKENGAIHLEGYFNQATANKTESRTLYWEWPMETGSTQNQINENDMLDSNWIGERIVLAVSAKGRQVTEENLTQQYAVTFDANGGTINGYGNSSQATKMVTYGEAYGALPTPTREGYRFLGWTSKNLIDINGEYSYTINGKTDKMIYDSETGIYTINAKAENHHLVGYKISSISAGKTYTISATIVNSPTNTSIWMGFGNKSYPLYEYKRKFYTNGALVAGGRLYFTLTIPDGGNYNPYWIVGLLNQSEIGLQYKDIQLELGDTATTYEPYKIIASETEVTKTSNHTLTAVWELATNQ